MKILMAVTQQSDSSLVSFNCSRIQLVPAHYSESLRWTYKQRSRCSLHSSFSSEMNVLLISGTVLVWTFQRSAASKGSCS